LYDVTWGKSGIIHCMRRGDRRWEELKPEVIALAEKTRDMYVSSEVIPTKLARLLIDTASELGNLQYRNDPFADFYLEFSEALGDLAQVYYLE